MFGLPTIKSGSTYGTKAEPLGLPMNKRRWVKYEQTRRRLVEDAASERMERDLDDELRAYDALQRQRTESEA